MPKCKNDITKSYEGTEPSPKGLGYCAHAENEGVKKKGKDGNMWITRSINNGTKRWIKLFDSSHLKGYKKYYIHNNGGRPYMVCVKQNDVYIYAQHNSHDDYYYENPTYEKLVKHLNVLKVFVGKSPSMKMTKFSGGIGPGFDGNTILLQIGKYKYMHISAKIRTFTTDNDEITHFVSPVGNNDVPYPFAIGGKYVYEFWSTGSYIDKKYFVGRDLDGIDERIFEYKPFFTSLSEKKRKGMTVEQFEIIRNTPLKDIPLNIIKKLATMYSVTNSGSKKEVVDRIERVRGVVVYKKGK